MADFDGEGFGFKKNLFHDDRLAIRDVTVHQTPQVFSHSSRCIVSKNGDLGYTITVLDVSTFTSNNDCFCSDMWAYLKEIHFFQLQIQGQVYYKQ